MTPDWSLWNQHDGASRNRDIPALPGVYRIRRVGQQSLDYIGQTAHLRRRMGNLNGIYGDLMPYNAPHTAGPGFWAILQDEGCDFEVSVAEVEGGVAARKGLECLLVSEHRVEHSQSPTLNFGRMPNGWTKSSDNTARLVAAGRRHRGHRDSSAIRVPDAPPPATLQDDPRAATWLQFRWLDLADSPPPGGTVGVYRAMRPDTEGLVYIGQGRIADRINNHLAKGNDPGHVQREFFSGDLTWGWVSLPNVHRTQLLEVENDLIASHVLVHGHPPEAQFLG